MPAIFLNWLKEQFGEQPTAAVGYSLGGNMLAYYLAESGENAVLDAAVIVSAPLMLGTLLNQNRARIFALLSMVFTERVKTQCNSQIDPLSPIVTY